jgi:predicted PurR-regulated permease PerM
MPAVEQALLSHLNIPALVFKTVDATAAAFIVVFIGIYLGAQSGMYWRGAVRLMPQGRQPGTEALLASVGSTLRWWMVGRSIAMLAVGVLDWIGLSLIGVPLARTLGIISGLLTFIPYIGSMLALIPTMLIALTVNPGLMLSAAIVHFVGQGIEAYLVTPLAQRKVVHMPPALTITAQFLMGAWAGILGLLFSTPLAAIGLVTVKKLYLHEEPDLRKR